VNRRRNLSSRRSRLTPDSVCLCSISKCWSRRTPRSTHGADFSPHGGRASTRSARDLLFLARSRSGRRSGLCHQRQMGCSALAGVLMDRHSEYGLGPRIAAKTGKTFQNRICSDFSPAGARPAMLRSDGAVARDSPGFLRDEIVRASIPEPPIECWFP
jgi:hypothetical protein